ncbi:hypothetical protein BDZ94DRAFT_1275428, partial [Collybia nuda]
SPNISPSWALGLVASNHLEYLVAFIELCKLLYLLCRVCWFFIFNFPKHWIFHDCTSISLVSAKQFTATRYCLIAERWPLGLFQSFLLSSNGCISLPKSGIVLFPVGSGISSG